MRPPAVDKRSLGLVIGIARLSQLTCTRPPKVGQRYAEDRTETRQARSDRGNDMRRLRALEELVHALGTMHAARIPSRKF